MKFSDKIFTHFTVLRTSQLYKNNINTIIIICMFVAAVLGCIYFFVDEVSFFVDLC